MKVMIISHEKDINGSTRSMYDLIMELKDKVHFYVVLPSKEGLAFEYLKSSGAVVIAKEYYKWVLVKNNEEEWNYWQKRWEDIHDKKNDIVARGLAEIIESEKIDIVHTNVGVLDIGARIKKYTSVKHIWHFREFGDLDFNMYPLVDTKKYYDTINRYSDCCVFNSKAVLEHYSEIDEKKKMLIYNGVSEKTIAFKHNDHEGINILIAGCVTKAKGQKLAALACEKLIDDGYNDFKLIVAGQISDEDKLELCNMLPNNIEICGYVQDLNRIRSVTDILLMCSKNEAFGRVTVEAMLAGIPVIGSNSGGTPEIIPNIQCGGLLFENGNIDDLKEKIKLLYNDEKLRKNIGQNGKERASKLFSMDRCANEIYSQYLKVIG